ncbi:unnamed protein product [Lupinus luteus]|uniref:PGG domain-containing protein n=1 Tax=Lupinus luteus TaxID=3873 RepID=A0AAV1YJ65_LUPLU
MDHLQIAVGTNDQVWKERCKERIEKLKEFYVEDAPSQFGLVKDKEIMNIELYEAVENGDVDRFVEILEQVSTRKGQSLSTIFDQVTPSGDSLLHVAANLGKEQIAELISHHFPELLTRRNINGDTALHVAARSKKYDIIKVILSQYREVEEIVGLRNEQGDTALHEAVNSRHLGVVSEVLLAHKSVAHCLNKSGKSPLYLSVLTGDVEIIALLLQIPFPANEMLPRFRGNSPLHAAISNRNLVVLKEILERRTELIYFRDEHGGTPLHYASYISYINGVRILLNASTQTALERNKKGHLPIHLACKRGHVEVVRELLLQDWPNPTVMLNQKGQNILHVAAKAGENDVVKYLLRNKKIDYATINGKDVNGNTPLHLAAQNLFIENLYSLSRDKRINVQVFNNEGSTPLDIVLLIGNESWTYRQYLSRMILSSAGAPLGEKVLSMARCPKHEIKIDWMKDQFSTLMVVSILITTVTFSAGFTVPGSVTSSDDPDQQKIGMAVLAHKPMFQLFTICNTIAMYSSMTVCIVLTWAQSDDLHSSVSARRFGLRLLGVALVTTGVAFLAAVRLVISEVSWLANVIAIIATMFLIIIVLSYTVLTFPLRYRHPILRLICDPILRIKIWYARTSIKMIPGKMENSYPKHVDKGKQLKH